MGDSGMEDGGGDEDGDEGLAMPSGESKKKKRKKKGGAGKNKKGITGFEGFVKPFSVFKTILNGLRRVLCRSSHHPR